MQVLVIYARQFDFEDDNKRRIQGGKIHYIDPTTSPADGEQGFPPLELSVDTSMMPNFTEVPGVYDLEFTQRRGRNNRPTLVLTKAVCVGPYVFSRSQQIREVPD